MAQGRQRLRQGIRFSDDQQQAINSLYRAVAQSLTDALKALLEEDPALAQNVVQRKKDIRGLAAEATRRAAASMAPGNAAEIRRFGIEADSIDQIHRLYYHIRRIAKKIVDEAAGD